MRAYVMDAFSKTLFGGNQANILKPLLQFSMAMAA